MCDKPCQEMQNLDAMHNAVASVIFTRTEFGSEDEAHMFYDIGGQYLSSILFSKYKRNTECHLSQEVK